MRISDEFKVGIAIVLGLVILVIGIFFLKGINVFTKSRSFYAFYENTNGLTPGSPITINGFQIGQVRTLELDETMGGLVKVDLYIENESLNIPIDTKAKIYSSDLLGSKGVMFELGVSTDFIKVGDTLESLEQEEMMDIIKSYINPLEKQAEKLAADLDDAVKDARKMINHIDTLSVNLDRREIPRIRRSIVKLSSNIQEFISVVKSQTIPKLNKAIDTYTNVGKKVDSINLKSITDKGDTLLAELNKTIKSFNSTEGTFGKLINTDEMHTELVKTAQDLQALLQDVKTNPNKYVRVSVFEKRTYEEKLKDEKDKEDYKKQKKEEKKKGKNNPKEDKGE